MRCMKCRWNAIGTKTKEQEETYSFKTPQRLLVGSARRDSNESKRIDQERGSKIVEKPCVSSGIDGETLSYSRGNRQGGKKIGKAYNAVGGNDRNKQGVRSETIIVVTQSQPAPSEKRNNLWITTHNSERLSMSDWGLTSNVLGER